MREGEKYRRLDLANLDFSTSYNFRAEKNPLSSLNSSLYLFPTSRLTQIRLSTVHNLYERKLKSLNLITTFQIAGLPAQAKDSVLQDSIEVGETFRSEPWRLSLSHNYVRGITPTYESQQIWGRLEFHLTKNWKVDYSQRYDLKKKELVSQDLTLYRNLHCWEARFHWDAIGARWSYEFKINIKALPDIKFERKKSSW